MIRMVVGAAAASERHYVIPPCGGPLNRGCRWDLMNEPSVITVYRKQSDGRWLLARDAHTLSAVGK